MNIRKIDLSQCIENFDGGIINEKALSSYYQFSLSFFVKPKNIWNFRIETTTGIDITDIENNYKIHYKDKAKTPASFTTFFKWILLKTMHDTPFNWRYLNDQWYKFNNLPLFITIRRNDEEDIISSFIYNVNHTTWEDFVEKNSIASKNFTSARNTEFDQILYFISNQIERLHIPRMTSYRTTIKHFENDSHRPSIIFSDPYVSENRKYLPIHFSISHGSLMPKWIEDFIYKLNIFANQTPEKVQASYQSFYQPELIPLKYAKL